MDASGFEPIATPAARVLILGTLPGQESLRRGEYYAHSRNAFWRIMEAIFAIPADIAYDERVRMLGQAGVALWDVCAAANRPGSLDVSICHDSVVANDFTAFLAAHPQISLICFNGAKARDLFRKHVKLNAAMRFVDLPSTSPANAAMSFDEKVKRWSVIRNGM